MDQKPVVLKEELARAVGDMASPADHFGGAGAGAAVRTAACPDRGDTPTGRCGRDPGSFRDPSGFVYHFNGHVYRAIDGECAARFCDLEHTGLLAQLVETAGLIPTRLLERTEPACRALHRRVPHIDAFLEHEKVPFVSYPYEWSTAMLADAATRCLDLQLLLMQHGHSLKDASAYNIQFVKGQPVFIDVPSIETVRRRDVWMALDQFCRMFLYPLLLDRHRKGGPAGYYLEHLDGMNLEDVYRRFGLWRALRPRLWLDVLLPYQLQRFASAKDTAINARAHVDRADTKALAWNLSRLKTKVQSLGRRSGAASHWIDYANANTYDSDEAQRKGAFIDTFLQERPPRRILDLGCNTGRYTELAARRGVSVVAVDSDQACIDHLYRRTHAHGWDVTPLVMNIANPSPGIGFRNIERASFMDRASFDCVFALALLHHLLVTSRLPLGSIVDLLADLTDAHLIVEFIDPRDEMFVSLLAARENLYEDLNLERYFNAFATRFDLIAQTRITEHRTLVTLRKKGPGGR